MTEERRAGAGCYDTLVPGILGKLRTGGIGAILLLGLTAVPSAAEIRYIAFGDSITNGNRDDPSREERGYPPRLEDILQENGLDVEVVNEGLGSETTVEGLARIGDALAQGGDFLLLMEGTNDISTGDISQETTLFNLDEMASRAAARDIVPIHATVIPRRPDARVDRNNVLTRSLNIEIRRLAWETGRGLIDPFEVFYHTPDFFEELYYQPGDDRTGHPDAEGYDFLARIFADPLLGIDSVPPVRGVVEPADGSEEVPGAATVTVELFDFGEGIDLASTSLTIGGDPVEAEMVGDTARLELVLAPETPWVGVVEVGVVAEDLAEPVNSATRTLSTFVVAGTVFLDGDLNLDGRVDGADLVLLALSFGSSQGGPRYDADHDLSSDGVIDGADLAILAAAFGDASF